MNNKIRILVFVSAALVVAIIGFSIYKVLNPTGQLLLALAPEKGTIKIDDRTFSVSNGQSVDLKPGDYTVSFSRDEFKSSSDQKVTIKKDEPVELIFVLEALTLNAEKLLNTPGSQRVIEKLGGKNNTEGSKILVEQNPILKILPIKARLYTITACVSKEFPNDPSKTAICANVSQPGLEPYVRKDLLSRGFNPDELELIFVDKYSDQGEV